MTRSEASRNSHDRFVVCGIYSMPGLIARAILEREQLILSSLFFSALFQRKSNSSLSLCNSFSNSFRWDSSSTNNSFWFFAVFSETFGCWLQVEIRHNSLRSAFGTYSVFSLHSASYSLSGSCSIFQKNALIRCL